MLQFRLILCTKVHQINHETNINNIVFIDSFVYTQSGNQKLCPNEKFMRKSSIETPYKLPVQSTYLLISIIIYNSWIELFLCTLILFFDLQLAAIYICII